jgi:hypothetical protein
MAVAGVATIKVSASRELIDQLEELVALVQQKGSTLEADLRDRVAGLSEIAVQVTECGDVDQHAAGRALDRAFRLCPTPEFEQLLAALRAWDSNGNGHGDLRCELLGGTRSVAPGVASSD